MTNHGGRGGAECTVSKFFKRGESPRVGEPLAGTGLKHRGQGKQWKSNKWGLGLAVDGQQAF